MVLFCLIVLQSSMQLLWPSTGQAAGRPCHEVSTETHPVSRQAIPQGPHEGEGCMTVAVAFPCSSSTCSFYWMCWRVVVGCRLRPRGGLCWDCGRYTSIWSWKSWNASSSLPMWRASPPKVCHLAMGVVGGTVTLGDWLMIWWRGTCCCSLVMLVLGLEEEWNE